MIINESNSINEARSIDIGGAKIYQYNGKYMINKDGNKKEISKDQYDKLLKSLNKSSASGHSKKTTDPDSKHYDNKDYNNAGESDYANVTTKSKKSDKKLHDEKTNKNLSYNKKDPKSYESVASDIGNSAGAKSMKWDQFDRMYNGTLGNSDKDLTKATDSLEKNGFKLVDQYDGDKMNGAYWSYIKDNDTDHPIIATVFSADPSGNDSYISIGYNPDFDEE